MSGNQLFSFLMNISKLELDLESLTKLFSSITGVLSQWQPPVLREQLALELAQPNSKPRDSPRTIDWVSLEGKLAAFLVLPTPISVLEAARRIDKSTLLK